MMRRWTLDDRLLSRYSYDTSCLLIQSDGNWKQVSVRSYGNLEIYQHAFLRREHVLVRRRHVWAIQKAEFPTQTNPNLHTVTMCDNVGRLQPDQGLLEHDASAK
jgi:hypothetical protein